MNKLVNKLVNNLVNKLVSELVNHVYQPFQIVSGKKTSYRELIVTVKHLGEALSTWPQTRRNPLHLCS